MIYPLMNKQHYIIMIYIHKSNDIFTAYVILGTKVRIISCCSDYNFVVCRVKKYLADPGSYSFKHKTILSLKELLQQ